MKIIHLTADDDIVSVCDRLDWVEARRVLLILPEEDGTLRDGLDLVRLRRHADRRRLEIGLVTPETELRRQAQGLGIPTFLTVSAAEKSRRGWWRGRRRRERLGLPTVGGSGVEQMRPTSLDPGDEAEMKRRLAPLTRRRQWLLRYFAIFLFFITIALLVVGFAYAVPRATLILRPAVQPVEATRQLLADPTLEEANFTQGAVPARLLQVTNTWDAELETTGSIAVPNTPGRGTVVFVNQTAEPVTVPAGTRVRTSAGETIEFQTTQDVTLPGANGSTAEVEVAAVEPGPEGNVEANQINQIAGSLATQLEVRNLEATAGGEVREVAAVTEADQARLRSQVLQYLQALAASEMAAQVTAQEFLARESLQVVDVASETFSHFPGEQTDRLRLEMRATIQGTAVSTEESAGLLFQSMATEVPPDRTLVPESLTFEVGEILGVDEAGRVTFNVEVDGVAAAELNPSPALRAISGQPPQPAMAYLYDQLPLRDVPTVEIWPTWFERIPYTLARIETRVER